MTSQIGSPYTALYDRVNKTAKCRFHAHTRMGQLHRSYQWTLTILSVLLLVVPLARGFGLSLGVEPAVAEVAQVILAVAVLATTLRIEASNYQLRSEKHLQCGKTLSALLLELEPCREQAEDERYSPFTKRYQSILDGYENHEPLDYAFMRLQTKDYYKPTRWDFLSTYARYLLNFLFPLLLLLAAFVWVLVANNGTR